MVRPPTFARRRHTSGFSSAPGEPKQSPMAVFPIEDETAVLSPPTRSVVRWDGWKFAVFAAAMTMVASAFLSFWLPMILGVHEWFMSGDAWLTVNSAQWVSHGAIGTVYEANPWYSALPGFLVLLAPVVALADHLGMVTSYPVPLPYPSMWLIVGPFFFLCGGIAVLGVDYLMNALSIDTGRRRTALILIGFLLIAPTPGFAGHPEDVLTIALVCFCIASATRQNWMRAMLILSAAVMVQTWAGLLIPALVAASPAGLRLRNLVRASLLPGACAALLLILDFKPASTDLLKQPMANRGQELPWWHMAGHMLVNDGSAIVSVAIGSSSRWLAVLTAALLGLVILRHPSPTNLVAVGALALLARGFFETEIWFYYLAPASTLFVVFVAASTRGNAKRWIVGTVFALLMTIAWPGATFSISISPMVAELVLLTCGAGALAAAFLPDSRSVTDSTAPEVGRHQGGDALSYARSI